MNSPVWFMVAGALFISVALASSFIARAPLTPAILYLGIGALLGPWGTRLILADPVEHASVLERLTEVAVIVSLFTAGLKLRIPLTDARWLLTLRLAVVSMTVTVLLVAGVVVLALGVPWGVGLVVGAILAPTDPVLASDVQVAHPFDQNRLRFGLTGEASLNDGTAFPFLLLGLGLLGHHELGAGLWHWIAVDVLWASAAGLGIGGLMGTAIGTLVLYLRRRHREAIGLDDFLALGLIAMAYGLAVACHAYGFLSVFAAGLALRRVERVSSERDRLSVRRVRTLANTSNEEAAVDEVIAPAFMAQALLSFNEQLERVGEVAIVVLVGAMLNSAGLWTSAWLAWILLVLIRPVSVAVGLAGSDSTVRERALMAWFGIRGIGSMYYLMFALTHGVSAADAPVVVQLTLATVACSIVIHGITVTPLMKRWGGEPVATAARALRS
jgi:sodium/hydrogen antiporter